MLLFSLHSRQRATEFEACPCGVFSFLGTVALWSLSCFTCSAQIIFSFCFQTVMTMAGFGEVFAALIFQKYREGN